MLWFNNLYVIEIFLPGQMIFQAFILALTGPALTDDVVNPQAWHLAGSTKHCIRRWAWDSTIASGTYLVAQQLYPQLLIIFARDKYLSLSTWNFIQELLLVFFFRNYCLPQTIHLDKNCCFNPICRFVVLLQFVLISCFVYYCYFIFMSVLWSMNHF